jgi:hypothetical protein
MLNEINGCLSVMHDSSLSVNYIEIGKFTKCDVNQMWILKTSKDLLEYIQSRSLSSCNSIKTFDFWPSTQVFPTLSWKTVCCKTRHPNIANMVSINNTSMLMISLSENFLVQSEWFFFLQNKICPFLAQFVSTLAIIFYETQLDQLL